MTKINDYLWQLPHERLEDDPPDVAILQEMFNRPIVALVEEPFAKMGYQLKSNDVMVKLGGQMDGTYNTYYANVRFIHYLQSDIFVRVHFEHDEWAQILPQNTEHRFFINLDRFKVTDPTTQIVVPAWEGRRHIRMSNRPEYVLEHSGEDQIWLYTSAQQLEELMTLFWEKFINIGRDWLEGLSRVR